MNGKDIHEGTRLLLSIDKSKVSQDIYDSLINIGLDSLKQDGKWRDICMFYIKNYMITKACSTIINHSSSFESGRQIWIRQLFDNALQICMFFLTVRLLCRCGKEWSHRDVSIISFIKSLVSKYAQGIEIHLSVHFLELYKWRR